MSQLIWYRIVSELGFEKLEVASSYRKCISKVLYLWVRLQKFQILLLRDRVIADFFSRSRSWTLYQVHWKAYLQIKPGIRLYKNLFHLPLNINIAQCSVISAGRTEMIRIRQLNIIYQNRVFYRSTAAYDVFVPTCRFDPKHRDCFRNILLRHLLHREFFLSLHICIYETCISWIFFLKIMRITSIVSGVNAELSILSDEIYLNTIWWIYWAKNSWTDKPEK